MRERRKEAEKARGRERQRDGRRDRLRKLVRCCEPHGKSTCIHMFIAALFTIVKTWKQPKCPSTDDWIRKRWYIYTMEYYLAIKKNDIMPFAAIWMELETLILNEVSQKEKDRYHMISLISGI